MDLLDGTASRVVELAKEAGVSLTPAGASFPNGDDPRNRNIRLAPTFPPLPEVNEAMEAVATCAPLAAAEKINGEEKELNRSPSNGAEASELARGSEAEDGKLRRLGDPRANGEARRQPQPTGVGLKPQPQGVCLSRNNEGRP